MLRRPINWGRADPGSVTAVHQFVPVLLPGDATGNHTLQVRDALRAAGLESEIFVEAVPPELEHEVHLFGEFRAFARGSVLLYQMAVGCVLADFVYARSEPLVVYYHNFTPLHYYRRWDPSVVKALRWGRSQLDLLVPRTSLALGVSTFNEEDLQAAGYGRTDVAPLLLDLDASQAEPDPATFSRLMEEKASGGVDMLFVGRLAPNKAQQDLIKALAVYRRVYDPKARLRLIGRPATDTYGTALDRFVDAAGVSGAVEIVGGLTQAQLSAYYRAADVFVSASEHEGFCIPLIEAMNHDVPVVAYASSAVPETVGDAAVLLPGKAAPVMAAAVHRVVSDPDLRSGLIRRGRARVEHFSLPRTRRRLIEALAPITGLSPGGPPP
ncbi:MAG TPA: glycosyltransferase [Acidimicrobiales bacterium]|nr:glycosyltransferase [Acidimicrobiales bacterium]